MLDPAVDDAGRLDPVAYGVQAALHLGDHAAGQIGQQLLQLGGGEAADHVVAVRPVLVQALDVGEDHQRLGVQRCGECGGGGVGVDVVDVVVLGRPRDGGDDRDPAVVQQCLDGPGVDGGDLADPADVHGFAVDHQAVLGGGDRVGVLARHADGQRSVLVEQADELPLDLSGQHHADDVHRLGRRDAETGLEFADQALLVELGADLRAAAVHDDGLETGVPQEDDVLGEGGLQLLVDHGVAAELDDDGLAVVAGQPGQRLDEDLRLGQRGVLPRGAHELYALFSWTYSAVRSLAQMTAVPSPSARSAVIRTSR